MSTGHYVFEVRAETGQRRRYGVRPGDARIVAYLDKLPNRSEFIRRAIENEIAGRPVAAAPVVENRETVERLARLERAVETLSADMKHVLNELRAMAEAGWHQPPAEEASERSRSDNSQDDGRPSQEELDQVLTAILNFGQKGGDGA